MGGFTHANVNYRFTFQYGEIKRARRGGFETARKIFTFQYGEIKSAPGAAVSAAFC